MLPLGAALWLGATLQNVLAAAVFARILAALLLGRSALKVLEIRRILPPQFGVAKGLFNFGGWMLIASVTTMIADSLDRVMLGTSLGARFVTYYTVPQNLVTRLNIVPTALVRTLFPRLSAVGRADADTITQQSLEFLNGVFTPVALVAMLVLEPFLHLWVGNEIATRGGAGGPHHDHRRVARRAGERHAHSDPVAGQSGHRRARRPRSNCRCLQGRCGSASRTSA